MPTVDESYRTLEVPPGASDEEVRRAWRELSKVWHPDRFGSDPDLRRRAEEKQKEINEAYETIRAAGAGRQRSRPRSEPPRDEKPAGWIVRSRGREIAAANLGEILAWLAEGHLRGSEEVYHPEMGIWILLRDIPEAQPLLRRQRATRWRNWGFTLTALAFLLLLRRPSLGVLLAAAVMFVVAGLLIRAWATVVDEP